jgi:YD repeat-containing protein
VRDGGEMTVTVPSAGSTTTFRYDSATHLTSVTSQ